jgi:hypothetical protein
MENGRYPFSIFHFPFSIAAGQALKVPDLAS